MQYHVDGDLVPAEEASVGVADRGFLYGDAAVADLRAYGGSLFAPDEHFGILEATCERIGIDPPGDLPNRCRETLAENDLADATLRVTVTRGPDPDGTGSLTPPGADARDGPASDPTAVVAVAPAPRGGVEGEPPWEGPADVQTVKVRRSGDRSVPATGVTGSHLPAVLARRELHAGADEALVRGPDGAVVGGADSNLFFVAEDGLHTPGSGPVYPGAVRSRAMEYAREADVPVHEDAPTLSAVRDAAEAFLTSTTWGVRPVGTVDGIDVGGGPVTELVRRQFEAEVETAYY